MKKNSLPFTKMHGLGNDFVVLDSTKNKINSLKISIPGLADRHVGIGFDQLLIIEPAKNADYFCRIYNADGSEAEQCGNGLRCVARYIHESGLTANKNFSIETSAGIYPLVIQDYDHIRITMGPPQIKEKLVELKLRHTNTHQTTAVSILSVGNPHAIVKVPSVESVMVEEIASQISAREYFTNGANVGFMQVLNNKHILLRTIERGVGETYACGSNACAAVVAGIVNHWLQDFVNVQLRYGSLTVEWQGQNNPIHMTGPAACVFQGEIFIS